MGEINFLAYEIYAAKNSLSIVLLLISSVDYTFVSIILLSEGFEYNETIWLASLLSDVSFYLSKTR